MIDGFCRDSMKGGPDQAGSDATISQSAAEPLLRVRGLSVSFDDARVAQGVDFTVGVGERVGLIGESGCGKSITGLSIMRLQPASARVEGRVDFEGDDILAASPQRLRQIRGNRVAMIFQEPMSALDPVFTIGEQISEALRTHHRIGKRECREIVVESLHEVGIPAPERRYGEYPHQLSGGMRQRAMIAMALICRPRLVIADEPTTALDVTIQSQIIRLLRRLSEEKGIALLFITHDLGVVAEICTRMLTMYAGQIIEDGSVDDILRRPRHPYTSGLLRSLPKLGQKRGDLAFIPGRVPSPGEMPEGCRFEARCGYAASGCENQQHLEWIAEGQAVRCHRHGELELPGAVG